LFPKVPLSQIPSTLEAFAFLADSDSTSTPIPFKCQAAPVIEKTNNGLRNKAMTFSSQCFSGRRFIIHEIVSLKSGLELGSIVFTGFEPRLTVLQEDKFPKVNGTHPSSHGDTPT